MTSSYIGIEHEHAKVLRFGANHNGKRAVVKIEIEVTDPDTLAWILRDVTRAQNEGLVFRSAAAEQMRTVKKAAKERRALSPPPLGLPYYGDRS